MKTVAHQTTDSIDRKDVLQDITLEKPNSEGRDFLVRIEAVSVNSENTKLRCAAEYAMLVS